ncbi:hypothetical protein LWI29_018855 [Acer saccharum]|uniref:Uncharacterized protein n=1 Tax=Acer saccharum TaxID=4024 RepID=A0AA39TGK3_ACESA|nr:hypothetical protein LWI29_018855 [Acer saccharum]
MRESWTEITLGKSKSGWLPWLEITELRIPQISISPYTECVFKNIMAFELFYYPTDTKLCHYADMMDRLIDTTEDVDLLVEKEIIINRLSDAELVVKMFNGICKDITLTPPYTEVIRQMKAHYRQPWNRWKTTLKRTYFSDIWTSTASFAVVFILILTIIQAVCSILQIK